ncbi:hypothetical protein CPB86DRAFT_874728 [Serendipita vermifera]|nr:hypothetical protein CPB86DRAFT_874728 [Serendipita vermifera]
MYLLREPWGKRQQQDPPPLSGTGMDNSSSSNDTTLPTYAWILVVLFVCIAVCCGFCARRRHRRQFMYRQGTLSHQRAQNGELVVFPATFSSADPALGMPIRPPPRARRRGSQESITSLPVYRENPSAHEVVLLQRTGPKDDDHDATGSQRSSIRNHEQSHSPPTQPVAVAPVHQTTEVPNQTPVSRPQQQGSLITPEDTTDNRAEPRVARGAADGSDTSQEEQLPSQRLEVSPDSPNDTHPRP